MNALEKLRSVVEEIREAKEPLKLQPNWDLAARLAARFPVDPARLKSAHINRDLAELDAIVTEIENPAPKQTAAPKAPAGEIDKGTLDAAMRAFKKRLKLQRLSDESKLGGRYTSGGRKSNIDAIIPPTDFPPEVWKALAAEGRLKDTGQGFYAEV